MTVSQYINDFLRDHGVTVAFELSGGMIMHLLDAVTLAGDIKLVNVYHEQAAAFAADAVGRLTGRPGVAFGTSGPGAINLLTGVGSSYFDSSPTLFITGQVNRHEQKGHRPIRQLGFQETDIVSMARPVTKFAERVEEPRDVPALLERAWRSATSARPGSALLDIPMDVFRADIGAPLTVHNGTEASASSCPPLDDLFDALRAAGRPLVLAGSGVGAANCRAALDLLARNWSLPVAHSLLACDVLPFSHPLRIGLIGTYGNRWANLAVAEADLLLVLGSRLDIRQTGADTDSFARGKRIFHVDVEAGEMNNRVKGCNAIHSQLDHFFEAANDPTVEVTFGERQEWLNRITSLRAAWPDTLELAESPGINPNEFMHQLSRERDFKAVCVDVGLHQMWAAQSLEMKAGSRFLTSGGMGAMGFALPAALGAALTGETLRPVLVVAGDGGFQINIQELQSVAHHRLPIKIVVMNNRSHGMTRQFQDTYFESRYAGTVWGYGTPDFAAVAAAYGIPSRRIGAPAEVVDAVDWLWKHPDEPALLEVAIDLRTNAYPKMAFGKPISEMEPFAKPLEMEGT